MRKLCPSFTNLLHQSKWIRKKRNNKTKTITCKIERSRPLPFLFPSCDKVSYIKTILCDDDKDDSVPYKYIKSVFFFLLFFFRWYVTYKYAMVYFIISSRTHTLCLFVFNKNIPLLYSKHCKDMIIDRQISVFIESVYKCLLSLHGITHVTFYYDDTLLLGGNIIYILYNFLAYLLRVV